jgi:hypothetical protein
MIKQKDYNCKGSVEKRETSGHEPHEAWHQDDLLGGKLPVVK